MNIDKFISKTLARHLREYRPLEGWEQLALIYHSHCPIKEKLEAYKKLLQEYESDSEISQNIRRLIKITDYWLDAPSRPPKDEHIFVSNIHIVEHQNDRSIDHGTTTNCFSNFGDAQRNLKNELKKVVKPSKYNDSTFGAFVSIEEKKIDSNEIRIVYFLDLNGEIVDGSDYESIDFRNNNLPEDKYIDLGKLFERGDIVTYVEGFIPMHMPRYGIIPFQSAEYSAETMKKLDYTDSSRTVDYFDDATGKLRHHHPQTWDLEIFDGELPANQSFLYELQRHYRGEKFVSSKRIDEVDDIRFQLRDAVALVGVGQPGFVELERLAREGSGLSNKCIKLDAEIKRLELFEILVQKSVPYLIPATKSREEVSFKPPSYRKHLSAILEDARLIIVIGEGEDCLKACRIIAEVVEKYDSCFLNCPLIVALVIQENTKIKCDSRDSADTVIFVENDKSNGNAVLKIVEAIYDVVFRKCLIDVNFRDLETVLRGACPAFVGVSVGYGENKCADAARDAISQIRETGAARVLLNIVGGRDIGKDEVDRIIEIINPHFGKGVNLIRGQALDPEMTDSVKVCIFAGDFAQNNT